MDIRDCFLMDKNNDIAKDVAYWKRRAYRPVRSDVVKWYIFKNFLSFPRKNMILAMGGTTAFMTENRKNFKVMSMERGWFSRRELIKNRIGLMPVNYWYWKFICAMETDEQKAEKYAQDMARVMKRLNPQVIILRDMYSAFHRSLAYAAHKADIPVVFYDHGLGVPAEWGEKRLRYERDFTDKIVDYFWHWSKKNMLRNIALGVGKLDNSYVVGYPYYYSVRENNPENKRTVMFVGSGIVPGESSNIEVHYDIVKKIFLYCKENNIEFLYRGHHKENGNYKDKIRELQELGVQFSKNTLKQDLQDHYITVGAVTTVMMEAMLYGNFVIQLVYDYEAEKISLCDDAYHVPDADSAIEMIKKAVDGELEPSKLNKDNLMYGELAQRTKEAIEIIQSNKKVQAGDKH
jgi:hypothetical protein